MIYIHTYIVYIMINLTHFWGYCRIIKLLDLQNGNILVKLQLKVVNPKKKTKKTLIIILHLGPVLKIKKNKRGIFNESISKSTISR